MNKNCGIYIIENLITKEFYLGSSRNLKHRWSSGHKQHLIKNNHTNLHLQRSWNKYGNNNFIFTIIENCSIANLYKLEQLYLDFLFPSKMLYNFNKIVGYYKNFNQKKDTKLKISLSMSGRTLTEEHKKNLSESKKGKNNPQYGKRPWNLNKKYSNPKISKSNSKKLWRFYNPDGKLYEFYNLTNFCKKENLHQGCMREVSVGNRSHHKKWRCA